MLVLNNFHVTSSLNLSIPAALDKLRKLWLKCGRVYVTQPVFNRCFSTIQEWISINGLMPFMMSHELITKSKQMSDITNPHHTSDAQMRSLLRHIDTCGKHAYFIFYVCLYESRDEYLGHSDAVEVLQKTGDLNLFPAPFPSDLLGANQWWSWLGMHMRLWIYKAYHY